MSRWARAAAATAATAVLAAPAVAQSPPPPPQGQVSDLQLPVLPLELPVSSLDGSVAVQSGRVTLQADVLFQFGSARLAASARSRIAAAVAEVRRRQPHQVVIKGYTDAKGTPAYNLGLSRRRAQAVRRALAAGLGTGAPPLQAVGRGQADPVATNTKADGSDDPRGRALNRRVQVELR